MRNIFTGMKSKPPTALRYKPFIAAFQSEPNQRLLLARILLTTTDGTEN
jgi:hypothetical protein